MRDNIFFTSDLHLHHSNILKYSRPQFQTIDEMHEALIDSWNAKVGKLDSVYILGDIAFGKDIETTCDILEKLNGEKWLVSGNHDKYNLLNPLFTSMFKGISPYMELSIDGDFLVLCHYPIYEWNRMQFGAYHLHGHLHGRDVGLDGRILDVGLDNNNLDVLSLKQVKQRLSGKPILNRWAT